VATIANLWLTYPTVNLGVLLAGVRALQDTPNRYELFKLQLAGAQRHDF